MSMEMELNRTENQFLSYRRVKRMLDVVSSAFILVFISPLLLLVYLAIAITDGRPAVFKQVRTGVNGVPFTIYKFRSMRLAHKQVPAPNQAKANYDEWTDGVPDDFVFKSGFNPNVTKLGAFLRKTSLDELLQFYNVLKGDMSIIGPRPEVPQITDKYNAHQRQRLLVKPGITGWAQVNGRSDIPHGDKIRYDLEYVQNCSLLLDVKIFLKTIQMVLLNKGSY
ncbi:sugar transferase [Paenibacillus tarimensis]|uniref:sugar transferase n=1 Tax=Paenibacillus tarimensis TaxID=416012 RepID=UPI0038B407B6|nr:sugar transferase [Paenibacillus tarimensis]